MSIGNVMGIHKKAIETPVSSTANAKPLAGKGIIDETLRKKADALSNTGHFEELKKLGMPPDYYMEKILQVAQMYKAKVTHDYHIGELTNAGGFTHFEVAKAILKAAGNLSDTNASVKIQKSVTLARKIANEKLDSEKKEKILKLAESVGSFKRQVQHDYHETHYVDEYGVRKPRCDD